MSRNLPKITEEVNNAIVKIGYLSANPGLVPNEGIRKSVKDLADHWDGFWKSKKRQLLPAPALLGSLKNYVKWYARAYWLVPPLVRKSLVPPTALDPTWGRVQDEWASRVMDDSAYATDQAKKVAKKAAAAAERAIKLGSSSVLAIGGGALMLGLGYWLLSSGGRSRG